MKHQQQRMSCGALLLLALCLQVHAAEPTVSEPPASTADEARISRVAQGLSTRVVVKDSPNRKMAIAERMAFHQVPAVSIAVIDHGQVAWARAYGVLDAASQRPATTTTLFQAASVSKAVSAIGALRLVERGKLSLDGAANRQLSAWQIPGNAFTAGHEVSLRMLLNHSAGLSVHGFDGYETGQKIPTLPQVLDGLPPANSAPVRVEAVPGSAWRYSGGGFSVVQLMMSEASQQPFEQYMQAAVLSPLGMAHSTFAQSLPPGWRELAATGHSADGTAVKGGWHVYPESAAAGLWTTPTDLARVITEVQRAEAGQSNKLLSRGMASTMLTRGLGEYGLGFFVENLGQTTSFSHSGGTEGFRSQVYGYTRSGQGAVVMTNGANGAALIDEVLCSIAAEYGWPEFQVTEKLAAKPDAAANKAVAGSYQLLAKPAQVIAEGEHLYFQSDLFGPKRMELFPESKTAYFMTAQDMSIRFELTGDGTAAGFSLIRGANSYSGTKQK
ncbi:MAG TPA: serine hydrolase domain-containing protein [Ideonella sp.]|uniref:serine hydrolase domain-containing protein n=1 Tax=Ideonella sp. TaxID=1929293 RepID=UPI002C8CBFAD|nr:serine hydrolase domain-containing protein [Ideonella sp.]HSI48538.1 serine hydrolase domain-containing protein [Ideonella sp.]